MNAHAPELPSSRPAQWVIHGLGLALIALIMGGNLYFDHRRIENAEKELLLLQTRIVQKVLDRNLAALDAVLQDIGEHSLKDGVPVDITHNLSILATALSGVRTLTVVDAGGVILASNRPELTGKDARHREYFTTIQDSDDPNLLFVAPPFRTSLGTFTTILGRRIQGPGGAFAGIVNAALDPGYFAPLLSSVLYAPDMRASLLHADGTVFLMLPGHDAATGENPARPLSLSDRRRTSVLASGMLVDTVADGDERRLLAARSITPPGLTLSAPLVVCVSRDSRAVFANWHTAALLQVGLYLGVILSSSLLLTGFQRRQRANEREIARAATTLAERERFIRMVTDNIPGMVAYWNLDMRCEYANKAYLERFGRTWEQMHGITLRELLGEELFAKSEPHVRAALRGEPQVFERPLARADGGAGHTLARYIPDADNGVVRGFYVLVSDVTELKTAQAELERRVRELHVLAATDPLTGIGNRRSFLDRAREEFIRSTRYGTPLAFLMIDVDHFKAVNDTYGHEAGDRLLAVLAATLRDALRTTDHVGRLGGEEFGALLIESSPAQSGLTAQRLLEALRNACVLADSGESVCYTVSIGMAQRGDGTDSVEDLMRRADTALYHAKKTGRDRICSYETCVAGAADTPPEA
jgi:diguanylate cyclase (GGDEF)-like protein/PAS domain S-box-containing protein